MNYAKQIKGFFLRRRLYNLSLTALVVYYTLLEQFAAANCADALIIPMGRLADELGLPWQSILRARCELIDKGYLSAALTPEHPGMIVYSLLTIDPEHFTDTPAAPLLPAPSDLR